MNERSLHNIRTYLQNEDVQERIRQNIQRGHLEATVTIGRAARLFNFTENQLRDWEDRGLIKPFRPTGGQRQYAPTELDKLAVIKELIEEGGYMPGSIPPDIDNIWGLIASKPEVQASRDSGNKAEHLPIDQRVKRAGKELFWRYFAPRAVRISLMMLCDGIPDTVVGLVLPGRREVGFIPTPEQFSQVGESLVGWLGKNRSIYIFYEPSPSFQYPSDYRFLPLQAMEEDFPIEGTPKSCNFIVVRRETKPLTLNLELVESIERLLVPLYEDTEEWPHYFGQGRRDALYAAPKFTSETTLRDDVLDGLSDIVVRLGGKRIDGQDRWRFCCILLPNNLLLPLQQRSLVVRAQSKNSPHEVGVTISPDKYVNSPSLRAYQSGHVVYRPEAAKDTAIAHREVEEPVHSAIALSVGGESGEAIAVLYISSDQEHSFPLEDRRILRMMGRIVEEVLMTYHARQQVMDKLRDLIKKPDVIDPLFENFFSENDFNADVVVLLKEINKRMAENSEKAPKEEIERIDLAAQLQAGEAKRDAGFLSLIAVDVDNQSILSSRYGDRVTRSLIYEVGERILDELRGPDQKLYHIYADRFFITLRGRTLEQAREKAQELILTLKGPYRFDALRVSSEQQARTASMLVLPDITVRLGVASFSYKKLEDLLHRYAGGNSVIAVREIITRALNQALERGKVEGGNVVISWDLQVRRSEPIWILKKVE